MEVPNRCQLQVLQKNQVGLYWTSMIQAKNLDTFSKQRHNFKEKPVIIIQKGVLKLFPMYMSLYLLLGGALKNHKDQKYPKIGFQDYSKKKMTHFFKHCNNCNEKSLVII